MSLNKKCRVSVKKILRGENLVEVEGVSVEWAEGRILVEGQPVDGNVAKVAKEVRSAIHDKRTHILN